jgi:predicted Zn-dependent peptidase
MMQRFQVHDLQVHVLPTNQFKTNTIVMFLGVPLTEESASFVSLLTHLFARANGRYPQPEAFREQLESMYGAAFSVNVQKCGNYQVVSLMMDVIADEWLADETTLTEQAFQFMLDCLLEPALHGEAFITRLVEEEKRAVIEQLHAVKNEKARYAAKRCLEEMCAHEPYRLSALGTVERIQALDGAALYPFYVDWLQRAIIDLYVVGHVSGEQVVGWTNRLANFPKHPTLARPQDYPPPQIQWRAGDIRSFSESMTMNQSKLAIGLRTPITSFAADYVGLRLYEGILGGFSHSKLFSQVREKHSLAYYVQARIVEPMLGIMLIQCGIDGKQKARALELIEQQLEAMRNGDFTAAEWQQTQALLANGLRAVHDSALELISFSFQQRLHNRSLTISDWQAQLEQCPQAAVVRAAQQVRMDTIFFLEGEG